MKKSIFTPVTIAALAALIPLSNGCTMISGASDLQIDDIGPASTSSAATDPDGGAPTKNDASANDASTSDAGANAGEDAASQVDASASAPDSSAPTCDPSDAKLTPCASDAALSPSIVSCNDYCASRDACCNPNACTELGVVVAGTWSQLSASCSISPDYEMSTFTEPIRGNVPGYFRCCCE